ncbi:MAG: sulfatase-like hydrolase/transferase [Candidatus Latescibacteria bacterium]|nr:sulfatase-like hydrolase/transferase [Candidatus Latescibacterota bacterium]
MKKPNVVLIVADDMGYGDFGVFNDVGARTPCLDALVAESVCLTQGLFAVAATPTKPFEMLPK